MARRKRATRQADSAPATRACCRCGREITHCNGFVKAGDMLDEAGNLILDFSGRTPPRELCGPCCAGWHWTEAGELEPDDGLSGE